ncbi:MAG: winged helix-turn-helix domain-containing protein [Candidatus Acidiferrales bacterium]
MERENGTNGGGWRGESPSMAGGAHASLVIRRFPPFAVNLKTRELSSEGRWIRLGEKPFLVLAALLEKPGELITREELRRKLWANEIFVDFDNNLNSAVASLRELLSDSARAPRYIETLPRLGYRFIGKVDPPMGLAHAVAASEDQLAPAQRASGSSARRVAAAAAVVLLAAASAWFGASRARISDSFAPPGKPPETPVSPAQVSSAFVDGVYLLERGDAEGLRRATELLARAAADDANHAAAHAALGEAWQRMATQNLTRAETGFARAETSAQRAVQLDASLAAPHRTLAMIRLYRDWDFSAAARESAAALAADPADAQNHLVSAMVSAAAGQPEQAVAAARRAIALDPANQRVRADLAFFLLAAGRLEEAAVESRQVLALQPDLPAALDFLLIASERLRRYEDAREAALRLMRLSRAVPAELAAVKNANGPASVRLYREWQVCRLERKATEDSWPAFTVAAIYAGAGRTAKSFEWLERAYRAREATLVFIAASPDLANMRHDPRFTDLARRVGVPFPPHS